MNLTRVHDINSTSACLRIRLHLTKMCCVVALTILCFTPNLKATILDDLFQWAAQQPSINTTTVQFAMTGNEITRNGLVSYAVGTLRYYPPHFNGIRFLPASFASSVNGITQYFSDRRFSLTPGSFINYPFNPSNTDPLTITISPLAIGVPTYSIDVSSSKWGFNDRFVPNFDVTTKILYGSVGGNTFLTISLCNQSSQRPIVIQ
jgi:hypothetical protein